VNRQRFVVILPEFVLKAFFFSPALKFAWLVKTDAYDLYAQGLKIFILVAVPATFNRSARGGGGGEEPHDCAHVPQVVWAAFRTVAVCGREVRQCDNRGRWCAEE
jgi:hypothetical protein